MTFPNLCEHRKYLQIANFSTVIHTLDFSDIFQTDTWMDDRYIEDRQTDR